MEELCQELNKDVEKMSGMKLQMNFICFFRKAAKLMVSKHGVSSFL